jgi:hypothetical protein
VTLLANITSGVTIAGLLYDCIPLAPWGDGTDTVGSYACGAGCIKCDGLSQDEYYALVNAFETNVQDDGVRPFFL